MRGGGGGGQALNTFGEGSRVVGTVRVVGAVKAVGARGSGRWGRCGW